MFRFISAYLAWTRTGLAMIGVSLGLLKWDPEANATEGYAVAFLGAVVLVMATHRYFYNMRLMEGGLFSPNVHGVLLVMIVVTCAIVTVFSVQLHSHREGG